MESLDVLLQAIAEIYGENPIFGIIVTAVSLSSMIAALTPTPNPATFLGKVYKIIDFIALNIGAAKDKGPKE